MKLKGIIFIVGLFLCSNIWAIKLPDGTDAMIGKFEKHSNGKFKSVVLFEPTEIKTSIGVCLSKTQYISGKMDKLKKEN
ncbi:MAG: hypothetical protein ACTTIZ_05215 [Treponema sp.]